MADRVYLDWNATAPLRREAREAMTAAMDLSGNPSSVHAEGRQARKLVEDARAAIAGAVGALPRNVIFTSGGTEANALALTPGLRRASGPPVQKLVVSAIEHASVLSGGRFPTEAISTVGVTRSGLLDLERLRVTLDGMPPSLVSVMLANNETGAVQPVAEAAEIVHSAGGLLHVDAIQAFGKIPFDISALNADMVTLSAHKICGPKATGALVLAEGLLGLEPLLRGGGQERGHRAGTENVAGIAGFGAAASAAMSDLAADRERMIALRDRLEARLEAASPEIVIFGAETERVPNTTLFSMPGMKAETAIIAFDLEGVAVSAGAACSSGKVQPSHVLAAMGVPPGLARGAVRVSFGPSTSESEIDRLIRAWIKVSGTLLKESPA